MNKAAFKRTVEKDVIEGSRVPTRDILTGKCYKQRGRMVTEDLIIEYFLERIPNSEGFVDLMDFDLNIVKVKSADFELHFKDPSTGEWVLAAKGPAPIDINLYDDENSNFIF